MFHGCGASTGLKHNLPLVAIGRGALSLDQGGEDRVRGNWEVGGKKNFPLGCCTSLTNPHPEPVNNVHTHTHTARARGGAASCVALWTNAAWVLLVSPCVVHVLHAPGYIRVLCSSGYLPTVPKAWEEHALRLYRSAANVGAGACFPPFTLAPTPRTKALAVPVRSMF